MISISRFALTGAIVLTTLTTVGCGKRSSNDNNNGDQPAPPATPQVIEMKIAEVMKYEGQTSPFAEAPAPFTQRHIQPYRLKVETKANYRLDAPGSGSGCKDEGKRAVGPFVTLKKSDALSFTTDNVAQPSAALTIEAFKTELEPGTYDVTVVTWADGLCGSGLQFSFEEVKDTPQPPVTPVTPPVTPVTPAFNQKLVGSWVLEKVVAEGYVQKSVISFTSDGLMTMLVKVNTDVMIDLDTKTEVQTVGGRDQMLQTISAVRVAPSDPAFAVGSKNFCIYSLSDATDANPTQLKVECSESGTDTYPMDFTSESEVYTAAPVL